MGLVVENLTFSYRCFPVLKGVDFSVEAGNLVCMLGKNGAGKSTLFRCILGLLKGYQGKITVDGVDLRTLKEKDMARKIAYIPQNHDQAFAFSVLDMVMMGTTSSQLVLIARAIAQQAGILIMDEPCANLDYGNQARVMEELKRLSREGYLIVQSTHSPDQAFLYADQAAVLSDGVIRAFGKPEEVLTEALLEAMYGIPVRLFDAGDTGRKLCMPERVKGE